ncbi:hypothetical protein GCM10023188_22030 [Pontibacter saemangeumensis]|uniref:Uncharacterized protein n=1 Tax=Pontibacter saemangeumensis TaxID=1084525 RepID=A0ABP8LQ47_9BACT
MTDKQPDKVNAALVGVDFKPVPPNKTSGETIECSEFIPALPKPPVYSKTIGRVMREGEVHLLDG